MQQLVKTAVFLFSLAALQAQAEVHISDANMAELIPGKNNGAVFMSLHNAAKTDVKLVSATADWAGSVEIHTHINDNGVMRMRQIEALTIPANSMQSLQRGGLHLMVFNVQLPLPAKPELTVCFDNKKCQTVTVKVKTMADAEHEDHAQHGKQQQQEAAHGHHH